MKSKTAFMCTVCHRESDDGHQRSNNAGTCESCEQRYERINALWASRTTAPTPPPPQGE